LNPLNLLFSILSGFYIFAIFFFADSEVVGQVNHFNPFSLLHIPLYGILTVLLALALKNRKKRHSSIPYTLTAIMAISVGILDEIHQIFIPNRDASIADVLLDITGVCLTLYLFRRFPLRLFVHLFEKMKLRLSAADE
jgi:VanZ family protein